MIVVVAGSQGLVGAACTRAFAARGHAVIALPRAALDITDSAAVDRLLASHDIGAVVCAAARPHVEGCESQPEATRAVNVDATVSFAHSVVSRGAVFVAFSSEYVFDGTATQPYVEDDRPNPINEYGRQKRDMETALGALRETLVIRTSAVYGVDGRRKNFVYQLLDKAAAGERVRVPYDQLVTPTYADNCAEVTALAVERGIRGVLHVAGPSPLSRTAFARLVASSFGLPDDCVVPCATEALQLRARRPPRAALAVEKARQLALGQLTSPSEGLALLRSALRTATR